MSFLNKGNGGGAGNGGAAARPSGAGRYASLRSDNRFPRLGKGRYKVEIQVTRKHVGFKGRQCFVEVKVLERHTEYGNPVGSVATMQYGLANPKQETACLPKLKRLCVVSTGFDNDNDFEAKYINWEDLLDRTIGDDVPGDEMFGPNPLKGAVILVEATESPNSQDPSDPFTNYALSPDNAPAGE